MTNDNAPSSTAGWLVEVRSRRRKDAHVLFAVAIPERLGAHTAVTNIVGELHCSVQPKCRLTARALAGLGVRCSEVKNLGLPFKRSSNSSDPVLRRLDRRSTGQSTGRRSDESSAKGSFAHSLDPRR